MKNTTIIALLLSALVLGTFGAGVVSAETNDAQTQTYDDWYGWMANHMGFNRGNGYGIGGGPGFCGGYGGSAPVASGYDTNAQEVTVQNVEDALEIAQDQIDSDVSENNIYQMGRWWIVYYTDDNGTIEQVRIDAFTGEVVEDYDTVTQQEYRSTNTRSYRGGMGYGMGYGMGGMGYGMGGMMYGY
ncbi:MAG: PepSY domain-containing protein [Methanosarcinaceae archaeon]|nr:PepSY domain-containing protein [Methanosarcinaceae archaeon]